MHLASDNTGPAHPLIIEALARANAGYAAGYGADALTQKVTDRLRTIFEAPEAAVHLVATGTAANSLILGTLARPWSAIFCAPHAHIQEDECNAPEFFTGGAKLVPVGGRNAKIDPDDLVRAIEGQENRGVHGPQRGPVSITQATEKGTVYSRDEIKAVAEVCRRYGLPLHMDGARFANALVTLGCSPAEMTWRAGVDAVSFGATKNGCLGVEAVIVFDKDKAWEIELRRKRAAHLFSKHRYLAAQMDAYLEYDLWLDMARAANAATARLVEGLSYVPQVSFQYKPQANIVFAEWPRAIHRRLQDAGAEYHIWSGDLDGDDPDEALTARLVTDWSIDSADIDRFTGLVSGRVAP